MTTTTTDPKLRKRIELVKKMLNQASCPGATSAEAESFMGKAQEWIEKFNITEAMLSEEEDRQNGVAPIMRKTVYNRNKGKMPTWILTLASGVSYANRCRHWYSSSRSHGYIMAAGTEANLQSFELLMPVLVSEVDRLYLEEKPSWLGRGEGKRWATSFRNGCSARIAQRVREARKKAQEAMKAEAGMNREERYKIAMDAGDMEAILKLDKEDPKEQSYALSRIETALTRLNEDEKRAKAWVDENMRFRRGNARSHYGSNRNAFSAGHKAGSRANINAPRGRING